MIHSVSFKIKSISQNSNFGKHYYFAKCVVPVEMSNCQSFQGILQLICKLWKAPSNLLLDAVVSNRFKV